MVASSEASRIDLWSTTRPISLATATAVPWWSPVIMIVLMPACLTLSTTCLIPGRMGSLKVMIPWKDKSEKFESFAKEKSSVCSIFLIARPKILSPEEAREFICSATSSLSSSVNDDFASKISGAPNNTIKCWSASFISDAENL